MIKTGYVRQKDRVKTGHVRQKKKTIKLLKTISHFEIEEGTEAEC